MKEFSNGQSGKCPFTSGQIKFSSGKGTKNNDWWPNQLNLNILQFCAHQNVTCFLLRMMQPRAVVFPDLATENGCSFH